MKPVEQPFELRPVQRMAQGVVVENSSLDDINLLSQFHSNLHEPLLKDTKGDNKTSIKRKQIPTVASSPGFQDEISAHNDSALLQLQSSESPRDFPSSLEPKDSAAPGLKAKKKKDNSLLLLTGFQILLATCATMFLVLPILSATVHSTFLYSMRKYVPDYFDGLVSLTLISSDGYVDDLTSYLNSKLLEVVKLGPTIYPILFAAVTSTTIRLVARWCAERGLYVETLEVLIGSRSLASTISTIYSVRIMGVLEIGLFFLWALSPLAGQPSLRVLSLKSISDVSIPFPWAMINHTNLAVLDQSRVFQSKARYISTVSWAMENAPEIYDKTYYFSDQNQNPLLRMSRESENYTSLVGFHPSSPLIRRVSSGQDWESITYPSRIIVEGQSSFLNISISQYEIRCPSMLKYTLNEPWTAVLGPNSIYSNNSILDEMASSGMVFFVDSYTNLDLQLPDTQHLIFGSFSKSHVTLWQCLIYESTRDVHAWCYVPEQLGYPRWTVELLPFCGIPYVGLSNITQSTFFSNYTIAADLLRQWSLAGLGSLHNSSLTEQFLAQGLTSTRAPFLVELSELDNITFAARFATIFNTLISSTKPRNVNLSDELSWVKITAATPLLLKPSEIGVCNWFFFTVLTLTYIFLILFYGFNIWLQHRLSTPEILGYVSSSTIDNPYILLDETEPGASSSLDGLKRAKLLGKMRVQIRDVQPQPQAEVGKFALTNEIVKRVRVRKDREFI